MRYILTFLVLITCTAISAQLREEPYLKFAKTYRDTVSLGTDVTKGQSVLCSRDGGIISTYLFGANRQQSIALGNSGFSIDTSRWGTTAIIKSDSNGNELWVKTIKAYMGGKIMENSDGNLLFIGQGADKTTDFDPGPDVYYADMSVIDTFSNSGFFFFLKLDPAGNFISVKPYAVRTGRGGASISDALVDAEDNIYICGQFLDSINFSGNYGSPYILAPHGECDAFVAKYNSLGELQWVQHMAVEATRWVFTNSLALDPSGNVYMSASLISPSVSYPGDNTNYNLQGLHTISIVKISNTGHYVWKKHLSDANSIRITNNGIAYNNGYIYLLGNYEGILDFNPGGTPYIMENDSNVNGSKGNGYVAKYDLDGNIQWVKDFLSINSGTNNCWEANFDKENNIYVTGVARHNVFLNPDILAGDITQINRQNIYHIKLNPEGEYIWGAALAGTYYDFSRVYGQAMDSNGNLYTIAAYYGQGAIDVDPSAGTYILDTCSRNNPLLYKWGQHMVNSVKESVGAGSLKLYPNPAGSHLHLDNRSTLQAVIRSMDGRLQWQAAIAPNAAIAVQQLPPGIYLLELTTADGSRKRIKWLKE